MVGCRAEMTGGGELSNGQAGEGGGRIGRCMETPRHFKGANMKTQWKKMVVAGLFAGLLAGAGSAAEMGLDRQGGWEVPVAKEAVTRILNAHRTTVLTVTFDANGGTCAVVTKGCTIGQPYKNLPVATREGYVFAGWYTAKDGGTQVVEGETVVTEVATRTLYAYWTTLQTVTFDANGGIRSEEHTS